MTGHYVNRDADPLRVLWHLVIRWLRKLVSHTMAALFCQQAGLSPLAFAQLVKG